MYVATCLQLPLRYYITLRQVTRCSHYIQERFRFHLRNHFVLLSYARDSTFILVFFAIILLQYRLLLRDYLLTNGLNLIENV